MKRVDRMMNSNKIKQNKAMTLKIGPACVKAAFILDFTLIFGPINY